MAKRIAKEDAAEKRTELEEDAEKQRFVSNTRQLGNNETLINETDFRDWPHN
jgi:hypothetical protein